MSISSEDIASKTVDLVAIPSPSGREEALADYVEDTLRTSTRPRYLIRHGNALVAAYGWKPGEEVATPRLALVGHLDTVPKAGQAEAAVRGGWVVGLGSTDMKGALAVMLALAETYPTEDASPLVLVFYDCEETSFDRNGLVPLFRAEPWLTELESAVLMEPTGNDIEVGCVGSLNARVVFPGKAAHSARPWLGENAVHKAGVLLATLAERAPREYRDGPASYREVLNVTMARGGEARNVIPDRFELNLNFRFPPDRTGPEAEAYLRSLLPSEAAVEIVDLAPAAPPRMDCSLLQALVRRFELPVRAKQAWTDVAQFAAHGVPAFNFGPGDPALAHRIDEKVSIDALARSYGILAATLRNERLAEPSSGDPS